MTMSEADTPKFSDSSLDDHDSFLVDDSIDELLSSLDDSPPENNETEINPHASSPEEETEPLQEQNHQLLHRNAQLQRELEATQAQLEQQQWRLKQAEDLNAQQNDELNAAYEQNLSLSQELKSCRTKIQHQEDKISQMSQQLKVSQQRVAQLERECALIQKQFQEQSYKLSQAEKQSRELSFRLQQQRRHTWQFKSALNKCLENNPQTREEAFTPTPSTPSQPIPSWSSQNQKMSPPKEDATAMDTSPTEEQTSISENIQEEDWLEIQEQELDNIEMGISLPDWKGNQPAPMVTNHRKKRKSYASVELPNFIR